MKTNQLKTTAYRLENVSEKRSLFLMGRSWKWVPAAAVGTAVVLMLCYLICGLLTAGPKQYRSEVLYAIRYDIHEEDEVLKDFINEYNAYTWGDMMRSDKVMLRVMELLPGEDRSAVEASLDTGIASDPEFLAAGFTTTDPARSEAIAQAFNVAMGEFAQTLRDRGLVSIEAWKTEAAVPVVQKSYLGNVGLLGLVLGTLAALFILRLKVLLDDTVYLTQDLEEEKVLGYRCKDSAAGADFWEKQTTAAADVFYDGQEACSVTFSQAADLSAEQIDGKKVLLELPWGKCSKALALYTAQNLLNRGAQAVGFVITDADAAWLERYYGPDKTVGKESGK